ncbi:MAG TPA: hypothetical protein VF944_08880 [Candidatus Bathyarchaeia archaeon]
MAAPVQPVPTGTPGSGTPVKSAAELASQRTQPTSDPPAPPTEPTAPGAGVPQEELDRAKQLIAAQDQVIRDMNAQITQRMRGVDERVRKLEAPAPDADELNQEFWKNPIGAMQTLIQEELKRTVGPLNDFRVRTEGASAYDRMKAGLKAQYGDIWPHIEGTIDSFVEQAVAAGNEVNNQLLGVAALAASGAYYRGQLPGVAAPTTTPRPTPPQPPTTEPTVVTPPHLRPSAPTVPGTEAGTKKERRELTENERRLARERGQSPEQYLDWLDVPPEEVVRSQIGRPEKK